MVTVIRKFVQLPNRLNSGPVIPSVALGGTSTASEAVVNSSTAITLAKNITYNMQTSKGIQVANLPASRINEWVSIVDVDGMSHKNPIFIFPPVGQTILKLAKSKISEAFAQVKYVYGGNGNWYTE
jgi:hypothetical protein